MKSDGNSPAHLIRFSVAIDGKTGFVASTGIKSSDFTVLIISFAAGFGGQIVLILLKSFL